RGGSGRAGGRVKPPSERPLTSRDGGVIVSRRRSPDRGAAAGDADLHLLTRPTGHPPKGATDAETHTDSRRPRSLVAPLEQPRRVPGAAGRGQRMAL